jgi:hypothetical protein
VAAAAAVTAPSRNRFLWVTRLYLVLEMRP